MKNKSSIKIYHMTLPIWILWIFPFTWSVVLPGKFIIDSLALLLTLKVLKINDKKTIYKKTILKIWGFGFLSYFIGCLIMIIPGFIGTKLPVKNEWWSNNLTRAIAYSPFNSIYSVLWITISIIITAFFIYLFNYKVSFKKLDIEEISKKKLALSLAIFTAPYLFFLPPIWFFQ